MVKLAWLTDIHLDFLTLEEIQEFAYKAVSLQPDIFLIGGDISVAPALYTHLRILEHYWQRPIYFVLGNHDFYKGSITAIRRELPDFLRGWQNLKWLNKEGIVELSPTTALIGHDLWADGRLGAADKSEILLNDYALIQEFILQDKQERFRTLNRLGDEATAEFEPILRDALARYEHVYALTHVPPFQQAAWHNHHIQDPQFLPHFTCHAAGEMMRRVMAEFPDKKLTVLCGHTHGKGQVQIAANIVVKTGGAEYRYPKVQEVFAV